MPYHRQAQGHPERGVAPGTGARIGDRSRSDHAGRDVGSHSVRSQGSVPLPAAAAVDGAGPVALPGRGAGGAVTVHLGRRNGAWIAAPASVTPPCTAATVDRQPFRFADSLADWVPNSYTPIPAWLSWLRIVAIWTINSNDVRLHRRRY